MIRIWFISIKNDKMLIKFLMDIRIPVKNFENRKKILTFELLEKFVGAHSNF